MRAINHAADDWSGFRSKDERTWWLISAFTDLSERFADSCSCRSRVPSKRTVTVTGSFKRFFAVVVAMRISPCWHTEGRMICESEIAVTKKLAQRFQRDDFCSRKTAVSRTFFGYSSKNVALGAAISARYAR